MPLPARAADVVAWLATQPLDGLPPVFNIQLHCTSAWFSCVGNVVAELQLYGFEGELIALARWAEHLGTTVTFHATPEFLRAAIKVPIGGHRLELWTFVDGREREALEQQRGAPISRSVDIFPSVLRQALRLLEESDAGYEEERP